jgi:hypothetical protein
VGVHADDVEDIFAEIDADRRDDFVDCRKLSSVVT